MDVDQGFASKRQLFQVAFQGIGDNILQISSFTNRPVFATIQYKKDFIL